MKSANLGELEKQIMDIIWSHKECSARLVVDVLNKRRKVAYTTITTILRRLEQKGLIAKRSEGIAYVYKPRLTKEVYSKQVAKLFLEKFILAFGDTAIASFAESIEVLPKKKRDHFLRLLREHE